MCWHEHHIFLCCHLSFPCCSIMAKGSSIACTYNYTTFVHLDHVYPLSVTIFLFLWCGLVPQWHGHLNPPLEESHLLFLASPSPRLMLPGLWCLEVVITMMCTFWIWGIGLVENNKSILITWHVLGNDFTVAIAMDCWQQWWQWS